MKVLVSFVLLSSCFNANADTNTEYPDYYQDNDKRLPYVNYDALMNGCMGKYPPSEGTPAYEALKRVCNKKLDQVKDPETFEGKIAGQDQLHTKQGIGREIVDDLWK